MIRDFANVYTLSFKYDDTFSICVSILHVQSAAGNADEQVEGSWLFDTLLVSWIGLGTGMLSALILPSAAERALTKSKS